MKLRQLPIMAALVSVAGAAILYGATTEADSSKKELEQQLKDALKTRAESAQSALDSMQVSFDRKR